MDRGLPADVSVAILVALSAVFIILICAILFGLKRPENKLLMLGFFSLLGSVVFSALLANSGPALAASIATGGAPAAFQRVGFLLILGGIAVMLLIQRPQAQATPGAGENTHAG